jgi:hypothetical protein
VLGAVIAVPVAAVMLPVFFVARMVVHPISGVVAAASGVVIVVHRLAVALVFLLLHPVLACLVCDHMTRADDGVRARG